jgi:D-aminopeptidase
VKILISADMEGATGVTSPADCEPGAPEWRRCRPMFTADVNAAIAGLFDGGATDVLVNEAHATMRNVLLEDLDERARRAPGSVHRADRVRDDPVLQGGVHADLYRYRGPVWLTFRLLLPTWSRSRPS